MQDKAETYEKAEEQMGADGFFKIRRSRGPEIHAYLKVLRRCMQSTYYINMTFTKELCM